jgi:hypothetical protein
MHSLAIRLSYNSQIFPKFRNPSPMTNAPICLRLSSNRISESEFDPFLFEVRTALHDTFGKVIRRFQIVTIRPLIALEPISRNPIVPLRPSFGTTEPGLKSSTAPCILMYGS